MGWRRERERKKKNNPKHGGLRVKTWPKITFTAVEKCKTFDIKCQRAKWSTDDSFRLLFALKTTLWVFIFNRTSVTQERYDWTEFLTELSENCVNMKPKNPQTSFALRDEKTRSCFRVISKLEPSTVSFLVKSWLNIRHPSIHLIFFFVCFFLFIFFLLFGVAKLFSRASTLPPSLARSLHAQLPCRNNSLKTKN